MSSSWIGRLLALSALAASALALLQPAAASAQATFNIRFHVILLHNNAAGDPCGGGTCMAANDFTTLVAMANRVYAQAGVAFQYDPSSDFSTLINLNLNSSLVAGSTNNYDAANTIARQHVGKLVVFLRSNPTSYFSWFPDMDALNPPDMPLMTPYTDFVLYNSDRAAALRDSKIFAHEVGHFLGLYHTHPSWSDCLPKYERINGQWVRTSMCETTNMDTLLDALERQNQGVDGDLLFDTEPDPSPAYWRFRGFDPCTGPATLIGNTTARLAYTPERNNVMSYFLCSATPNLTDLQVAWIRNNLNHRLRRLWQRRVDHVTTSTVHAGNWGDWADQFQYCPAGSFAYGINLKSEADRGNGDDSALNGISLHCYNRSTGAFTGYVTSTEGPLGTWQASVTCSSTGDPIVSANLRVQAPQGNGVDDVAASGMRMNCKAAPNVDVTVPSATSIGTWGGRKGCGTRAVCGIRTRVEAPVGSGDDTGLNGVQFACCAF